MTSSFPAAMDYLVAQTKTLTEVVAPAVVADGWPLTRSDQMIVYGINPEEDDSEIAGAYSELDRGLELETVEVPSIVAVRKVGGEAMAGARARAFELFDAIRELVRSDRRFGGAIRTGMPARVARWSVSQTAEPREAGEGRWCEIRFVLAWQHRG